jgi:hypothetical protein
MTEKKMKIVFAPGCFDNLDMTQEEMDELLAEINRMVDSGEMLENLVPLGELDHDDLPDDVIEWLEDDAFSPKNTRH